MSNFPNAVDGLAKLQRDQAKIAPAAMPPAEGGAGVNAAQAYQDAISGRAPQFIGLADTADAARQWLQQPFLDPREADVRERVAAGKAAVAAAKAKFEASLK